MWLTTIKPEEQGDTITIHIGNDVTLKLSRRASVVHVGIDAPREVPIRRPDRQGPLGVDD